MAVYLVAETSWAVPPSLRRVCRDLANKSAALFICSDFIGSVAGPVLVAAAFAPKLPSWGGIALYEFTPLSAKEYELLGSPDPIMPASRAMPISRCEPVAGLMSPHAGISTG